MPRAPTTAKRGTDTVSNWTDSTKECAIEEIVEVLDAYQSADDSDRALAALEVAVRIAKRAKVPAYALLGTLARLTEGP